MIMTFATKIVLKRTQHFCGWQTQQQKIFSIENFKCWQAPEARFYWCDQPNITVLILLFKQTVYGFYATFYGNALYNLFCLVGHINNIWSQVRRGNGKFEYEKAVIPIENCWLWSVYSTLCECNPRSVHSNIFDVPQNGRQNRMCKSICGTRQMCHLIC